MFTSFISAPQTAVFLQPLMSYNNWSFCSSVVTSVSVIMDTGNGSKAVFMDAVGNPVSKPSTAGEVASPINLLNPDRYEFYTFDDSGDLVKRLMTLEEIQGIIATGDGDGLSFDSFTSQGYLPEKRVNDIVNNVQNVLKEEIETHKEPIDPKPIFDTPDVSDSWSMILPAIFGNSGEDIKPERPIIHVTPDTIMLEPTPNTRPVTTTGNRVESLITSQTLLPTSNIFVSSSLETTPTTSPRPIATVSSPRSTTLSEIFRPVSKKTPTVFSTTPQISTTEKVITLSGVTQSTSMKPIQLPTTVSANPAMINVQVFSNSKSTTEQPKDQTDNSPIVEIKPASESEVTKDRVTSSVQVTTYRSTTNRPTPTTVRVTRTPSTKITPPLTQLSSFSTTSKPFFNTAAIVEDSLSSSSPTQLSSSSIPSTSIPTAPPKNSLPTLAELLNLKPSEEITMLSLTADQKTNSSTSPQFEDSTTSGGLSTFFEINDSKIKAQSTTEEISKNEPISSTLLERIQTSTIKQTENPLDDLATLGTEYVRIKPNITREPSTTLYFTTTGSEDATTTELSLGQSLTNIEKISATELLDQLLLTSTNIYEINSELSEKPANEQTTTVLMKEEDRFETTTSEDSRTTTSATTTTNTPSGDIEDATEPFVIKVQESTTDEITTERTLLESIEQLLSQAVGNIEQDVANEKEAIKVQQIMSQLSQKNMTELQTETATIASSLMEGSRTTTEPGNTETTTLDDAYLLSDAVGSLLSQVYGLEEPSLTTVEPLMPTEKTSANILKTTVISTRKTDELETTPTYVTMENVKEEGGTDNNDENLNKTGLTTEGNFVTTLENDVTKKYEEIDLIDDSTTHYIKETDKNTTEEIIISRPALNDNEPHIINITIIESVPNLYTYKPTKLEHNYKKDDLESDEPSDKNEILKADAASSIVPQSDVTESTTTSQPSTTVVTTVVNNDSTTANNKNEENQPVDIVTTEESLKTTLLQNVEDLEDSSVATVTTESTPTTDTFVNYETTEITTAIPLISNVEPSLVITINENDKINQAHVSIKDDTGNNSTNQDTIEDNWTLVPTVPAHSDTAINEMPIQPISSIIEPPKPVDLVPKPLQGFGLEDSTSQLDTDIYQFAQLCNELAFGFWKSITTGVSSARSLVVSPFSATSLLAMVFLGARGATSGEMNEILKLDDMVTFNPHLIFKNVSESIEASPDFGVATSAIIRELYSDRSKGKLLGFYKERARAFYDGHVEEVSYREIGDIIRRRTNLLVKRRTAGKLGDFLRDSKITVKPPLAGVGVNIFQTDCSQASTDGRDGELHFVVLPTIRQRRLIPIPAVVYRSGFLAGYEPSLDATAVAIGTKDQVVSTIFVIPGQQGISAPGDGLARLEKRLVESSFKKGAWSRLLRSLIPRPGIEVQIPRFSHNSIVNASNALKRMGLKDLFDADKADLRGLNGVAHELHLSDMLQINNFATCGESRIGETHHSEIYPATPVKSRTARTLQNYQSDEMNYRSAILEEPRDYQRAFHDPVHDPSYLSLPLPLRPRQARLPEVPRLRFDRPFLYFVRHNPTGLIIHMGRFNPRLLP